MINLSSFLALAAAAAILMPAQTAPPTPSQPAGQTPAKATEAAQGDPYTLATCPVSGQKFGAMGETVVKEIDGREVRFCCGGCVGKFEAAKAEYFKKIDEELIKQQRLYYPVATCVVMEEALTEDGKDIAFEHIYKNRLLRLCCKMCARKVDKDATEFIKKLDEAIIKSQRDGYPLDTCPVSGQKLGSMGEPVEMVVGNRLVRLCCGGCVKSFRKDPLPTIAALDTAWKAKGFPGKVK